METTLRLLPVCECGHIIDGLIIDQIVDTDGWKSIRPFAPDRCPNCNKVIESLTIDTNYLKAFGFREVDKDYGQI